MCGLHYIRSTEEKLRFRYNTYKSSNRLVLAGGTPKERYFHDHFLRDNHHGILEDCEIRIIDKTNSADLTQCKYFWVRLLKALTPRVLNLEEDV